MSLTDFFDTLIIREARHPTYAGGAGNEAHDVYARLLYSTELGHALFLPSSTDSSDVDQQFALSAFQRRSLQIGDIGYLDRGSFKRLFNVLDTPQNDTPSMPFPLFSIPVEWVQTHDPDQLPRGQTILSNDTFETSFHGGIAIPLDPTLSLVTASGHVKFSSSASAVATLALPTGGDLTQVSNPELMIEFIYQYGLDWIKYINKKLRCNARNGSVLLVTGYVSGKTFASATKSQRSQQSSINFELMLGPLTPGFGRTLSWSHTSGLRSHVGPRGGTIVDENQMDVQYFPFVRGYLLSVRKSLFTLFKMKLSVQDGSNFRAPFWNPKQKHFQASHDNSTSDAPNQSSYGSSSPSQRGIEGIKNIADEDFHPLLLVNDILLDLYPDAVLAISHDDSLTALLEPGEVIPDRETIKGRMMKQCTYRFNEETGVVLLDLPKRKPTASTSKEHPSATTLSKLPSSLPQDKKNIPPVTRPRAHGPPTSRFVSSH